MNLINRNQIRHSGIMVSDNPFDKTRCFGITADGFHFPFTMQGTTVHFDSRVPTAWEYDFCQLVKLTVDTPWNPGEGNISATAASTKLTFVQVTYQNVCALDRIPRCDESCGEQCNCGLDLSVLEGVSCVRCTVSAVNVATANRENDEVGLASPVGAKERHYQVSAETVARKFRCDLETAQRTLKTTTQRGVRHAMHPIHRRYRVDHLNLHRQLLRDVRRVTLSHRLSCSLGSRVPS
jgi:hypothetical protein